MVLEYDFEKWSSKKLLILKQLDEITKEKNDTLLFIYLPKTTQKIIYNIYDIN